MPAEVRAGQLGPLPPHDTGAEMAVLGAALLGPDAALPAALAAGLDRADFWWHHHQLAWGHLLDLWREQCDPGPLTLWQWLDHTGDLADFGGGRGYRLWVADAVAAGCWTADEGLALAYLAGEVADGAAEHATRAAERVRVAALRRRVLYRAREMERDATLGGLSPDHYAGLLGG